ncbi:hypothetical protein [Rhizobacter sp. Root1221]|uniref:hypothetical protein n=1 Tax=Rhizobacter sp. Root1221 TaxID=1736433 RepID=UPI000712DBB9|nr:hypothetical protein [Rhizobacter sp. Root1221]KQV85432.1 hypothetical protein ASC87_07000 [Rhizobacter sp. Root1221]
MSALDRMSLRAAVAAATNPPPVKVEIPGLGEVFVAVQTIYTASQNRKRLDALRKDDGLDVGRSLSMVLCDEAGAMLFDIDSEADAHTLSSLTPDVVRRIYEAANKANGPKAGDEGNA